MAKNPLLVRSKVGRAAPPTQDLPDESFAYGKPTKSNDGGVKAVFENWERIETAPTTRRSIKEFKPCQDFVATNKAALRHGCRTAKEFRDYQLAHAIMKKADVANGEIESHEDFHTRVTQMCHGIHTPVSSEMDDCLTFKFARDAKARAMAKRELEATSAKRAIRASKKTTLARGMRATRASRGHTYVAYTPPKESDTFKMKKFTSIDRYAIDDKW